MIWDLVLAINHIKKIDRTLLFISCIAFIAIPFATITELHALFLVIIAGVCISWWGYLSYTDGAATFGMPSTDRVTAYEHIIWMFFISVAGTLFVIGGTLFIITSTAWIDIIIPACIILVSIRMMVSCILLGKDGIMFLRNYKN